MIRRPPRSPLFPSTPLSRSQVLSAAVEGNVAVEPPRQELARRAHRGGFREVDPADLGGEMPRLLGMGQHELGPARVDLPRSEEHTSELQSQSNLVCRLLLEK